MRFVVSSCFHVFLLNGLVPETCVFGHGKGSHVVARLRLKRDAQLVS